MPGYSVGRNLLLLLHIAAAVYLIGPITILTVSTPRAIRNGPDGLPVLRFFHRSTLVYGYASVVVLLLGLTLVQGRYSYNQFWLSASMTLFAVAILLTLVVAAPSQRKAIARLEAGESASVNAGRVAAAGGASAVIWFVILALMVYKPGT